MYLPVSHHASSRLILPARNRRSKGHYNHNQHLRRITTKSSVQDKMCALEVTQHTRLNKKVSKDIQVMSLG